MYNNFIAKKSIPAQKHQIKYIIYCNARNQNSESGSASNHFFVLSRIPPKKDLGRSS